jgi:hypothetical protein
LDEVRSFFEKLREQPAPAWPEGASVIGPDGGDLRAESEQHCERRIEHPIYNQMFDAHDFRILPAPDT